MTSHGRNPSPAEAAIASEGGREKRRDHPPDRVQSAYEHRRNIKQRTENHPDQNGRGRRDYAATTLSPNRSSSVKRGGGESGSADSAVAFPKATAADTRTRRSGVNDIVDRGVVAPADHPRVLFLDMDGTLIGRINPQLCEYEALNLLQKNKVKQLRSDMVECMRHGIARPFLAEFCRRVTTDGTPTELFVFTASDDKWAKFMVPVIEEAIGFKFNRPLFTRVHCQMGDREFKKSLVDIAPIAYKSLRKKYPQALQRPSDVLHNCALIDNNHHVASTSGGDGGFTAGRLVKCTTYVYEHVVDVLAKMDSAVLHNRYKELIPMLRDANLYPRTLGASRYGSESSDPSFEMFMAEYLSELAADARAALRDCKDALQDKMWLLLANALTARPSSPRQSSSHHSVGNVYYSVMDRDACSSLGRLIHQYQQQQQQQRRQ